MFEALISQVKLGRIKRKLFETLSEAEEHLERERTKLLERTRKDKSGQIVPCPASLGDYRMEIVFRECPALLAVALREKKPIAA